MLLTDKVSQFTTDSNLVHAWVHGTDVVMTEGGPVRTPAKLIADKEIDIDAATTAAINLASDLVASTGASLVGYLPAGTGAVTTTVQSKLRESVSVKDFGAVGDGVTDDTLKMSAAVAASAVFDVTSGTYLVSEPIVINTPGAYIRGASKGTVTIKASPSFVGSALLVLGNKNTTNVVSDVCVENIRLDCSNLSGVKGLEFYGLRDGSSLKNIYVTNFTGTAIYSNMAGDGTGIATGKMSQGVHIENVHAITSRQLNSVNVWDLNGLFESTLIGCKTLGNGGTGDTTDGTVGFYLGRISQTRGVRLINCSIGNLGDGTGKTNGGIRYGDWTNNCSDLFTTLENIHGWGVYFHGDTTAAALCNSLWPRTFNTGAAGDLDPVFRFGSANSCNAGPVVYYANDKVWFQFDGPGSSNNYGELQAGVDVTTIRGGSSIVRFGASSANSESVRGVASSTSNNRQTFFWNKSGAQYEVHGNGTQFDFLSTESSFQLGSPSRFYFKRASGARLLDLWDDAGTSKIGFFGAPPVTRQTLSAAATDAATTQALANSIRTALIALGLSS